MATSGAVSDFLWSSRARSEFAALFDDGHYSDAFLRAVADALVRGWSNNRDKPFWALLLVVTALGRSGGGADGMDLIWQETSDVRMQLGDMPDDALASLNCSLQELDGGLLLLTPDGDFRLTNHRLRVLRKLAEFFLCCDEFAHAQGVMSILANCAGSVEMTYADFKDATREFSRIAYRFRTDNFLDSHASSAFSVINSYLAKRDFELVDHTIFEFWAEPDNERYKTYEATYQAFANYADSMDEARLVHAEANASDIQDPALAGAMASLVSDDVANDDFAYEMSDDEPTDALASYLIDDDATDDDGDADRSLGVSSDPTVLGDANLRLFGQKDIVILARLFEIEKFATEHRHASARLISFHPVQSGISNGLRTGKSKIPLSERLTCCEAKSYAAIINDLDDLLERATSWLGVAYALASDADSPDPKAQDIRKTGLAVLAKSRSKSLQKDPETLKHAFLEIMPALIKARDLSDRFGQLFRTMFADAATETLSAEFATDKALFAAEFRRRYDADVQSGGKAASDATQTQQGSTA